MKVQAIIEQTPTEFWRRIEGFKFLPVTVGENTNEVLNNFRLLITDYIEHEGKGDPKWQGVGVDNLIFKLSYE